MDLSHSSAKAALAYAAVNAVYSTAAVSSVAAGVAVFDAMGEIGPRWVAVIFALIGALWRWHKYRLTFRSATSGAAMSAVLAFIWGDTQIPMLGSLFSGLRPESIPMLNGFAIGLFGLLIVTGVQDFIAAYIHKEKAP